MSTRKSLIGFVLAALAAVILAACGGSGSGGGGSVSTLDPAGAAPADSLIYFGVTVRPQGGTASEIARTVNKLAGKNVIAKLPGAITKLLRSGNNSHTSYAQLKPWLGENVGFALVKPAGGSFSGSPDNSIVLILPTDDTSAAASWAQKTLKHQGSGPRSIYKVAGNYLLIGGKDAVPAAATAVKSGSTLESSSAYKTTQVDLAPDSIVTSYIAVGKLSAVLRPLLKNGDSPEASQLEQELGKLGPNAAAALGLELKSNEIRLDITQTGTSAKQSGGSSSNVSSLPGDSWLAIADNEFSSSSKLRQFDSIINQLLATVAEASALEGGASGSVSYDTSLPTGMLNSQIFELIEQYVVPALGPLSLSVAGTSPLALHAGFDVDSLSKSAQARLMSVLYSYARHYLGSGVKRTASGFTAEIGPSFEAKVSRVDGRLVITYGYASAAGFLHPAQTLADNPTFKQALAQLPSGSENVPIYLNFSGIAALASLDHNSSDASTMRVLKLLKYAIVGGVAHDERIVIGLN